MSDQSAYGPVDNCAEATTQKPKFRLRTIIIISVAATTLVFTGLIAAIVALSWHPGDGYDDDDHDSFNPFSSDLVKTAFDPTTQNRLLDAESKLLAGQKLWNEHKYREAGRNFIASRDSLQQCMPDGILTATVCCQVGEYYYEVGEYRDAAKDFREAARIFKRHKIERQLFNTRLWIAHCMVEDRIGRDSLGLPKAIEYCDDVIADATLWQSQHKGNPSRLITALNLRGYAYSCDPTPLKRNAIKDYESALSLMGQQKKKPSAHDYAVEYLRMANVYRHLTSRDYKSGIECCDKALSFDPNYVEAVRSRMRLHRLSGDLKLALEDVNKAIALEPKNEENFDLRAALMEEMHKPTEAIADLTQSLLLNPKGDYTQDDRGRLYLETRQYAKAVDDFTTVIERGNPHHLRSYDGNRSLLAAVYTHRAAAYEKLSDKESAKRDLKSAAAIDAGAAQRAEK